LHTALANITDNTSELPLASVQAICNFISVPAIETISFSAEITNHLWIVVGVNDKFGCHEVVTELISNCPL
jgi:hypothetical protein